MLRPCEMMYCIIGQASLPSPLVMIRRMGLVDRMDNVVERDTIMPYPMTDAFLKKALWRRSCAKSEGLGE